MNRNIVVAKELVKIAKSMCAMTKEEENTQAETVMNRVASLVETKCRPITVNSVVRGGYFRTFELTFEYSLPGGKKEDVFLSVEYNVNRNEFSIDVGTQRLGTLTRGDKRKGDDNFVDRAVQIIKYIHSGKEDHNFLSR